ncbi:MAG: hypothetical protein ACRDKV_10465, partial [Solirubrobacterales bacterium]
MSAKQGQASKVAIGAVTLAMVLGALGMFGLAPKAAASKDQFAVLDPTPQLLNGVTAGRRADILDRLQA